MIANSENLKDIIIVVLWPVSTIPGTYPTPAQIKTQFDIVAVSGLEPPTFPRRNSPSSDGSNCGVIRSSPGLLIPNELHGNEKAPRFRRAQISIISFDTNHMISTP